MAESARTVPITRKKPAVDAQIQRQARAGFMSADTQKSRARTSIPASITMRFRDGFRAADGRIRSRCR
jgi:hypothetical protein